MRGFDSSYLGVPPWDIGKPQDAIVRLEQDGTLRGSVLDCGCGTGENALYLAQQGHEVWGIDASPNAIRKAQEKAKDRNIAVKFLTIDALDLGGLGRTFDIVIDCGLFHVFSDPDRKRYVSSLTSVTAPGARLVVLCFSDLQPGDCGHRRMGKNEMRQAWSAMMKMSSRRLEARQTLTFFPRSASMRELFTRCPAQETCSSTNSKNALQWAAVTSAFAA